MNDNKDCWVIKVDCLRVMFDKLGKNGSKYENYCKIR